MDPTLARELLHFIKNSPTCYHVTENIRGKLLKNGYTELSERERSQSLWSPILQASY